MHTKNVNYSPFLFICHFYSQKLPDYFRIIPLCFEVPIILKITPEYSAHPYRPYVPTYLTDCNTIKQSKIT